jgi:hypothetical protein
MGWVGLGWVGLVVFLISKEWIKVATHLLNRCCTLESAVGSF